MTTYYELARFTALEFWRKARRSDFVYNVVGTFGTRILLIGIGLVTNVIIARILGPEGRGAYAVAMVVVGIGVQFGNLGLHASNTYYVAQDGTLLPRLVSNTLLISLGLGGLGVIIAWFVFFMWPAFAPVQGYLLILALLWIPIGLTDLLLQNLLLGTSKIRIYNTIALVTKILTVALLGGVIFFNILSVEIIFLASLITVFISCIWSLCTLVENGGQPYLPSVELFQSGLRYGFKAYLAAFFAYMVLRVDLIMVEQMLGTQQAGYYSIAVSLTDLIYMFPVTIGTLLFPKLSAVTSHSEKLQLTFNVSKLSGVALLILVMIASILAKPSINILYGENYLPSSVAFIGLLPGIFFLGIETTCVQYLNSIGFPKSIVIAWGGCMMINILLNLWAIPTFGILGASLVSSFSYFVMFVLILLIIKTSR